MNAKDTARFDELAEKKALATITSTEQTELDRLTKKRRKFHPRLPEELAADRQCDTRDKKVMRELDRFAKQFEYAPDERI